MMAVLDGWRNHHPPPFPLPAVRDILSPLKLIDGDGCLGRSAKGEFSHQRMP
jgi:hypothetical protein